MRQRTIFSCRVLTYQQHDLLEQRKRCLTRLPSNISLDQRSNLKIGTTHHKKWTTHLRVAEPQSVRVTHAATFVGDISTSLKRWRKKATHTYFLSFFFTHLHLQTLLHSPASTSSSHEELTTEKQSIHFTTWRIQEIGVSSKVTLVRTSTQCRHPHDQKP